MDSSERRALLLGLVAVLLGFMSALTEVYEPVLYSTIVAVVLVVPVVFTRLRHATVRWGWPPYSLNQWHSRLESQYRKQLRPLRYSALVLWDMIDQRLHIEDLSSLVARAPWPDEPDNNDKERLLGVAESVFPSDSGHGRLGTQWFEVARDQCFEAREVILLWAREIEDGPPPRFEAFIASNIGENDNTIKLLWYLSEQWSHRRSISFDSTPWIVVRDYLRRVMT